MMLSLKHFVFDWLRPDQPFRPARKGNNAFHWCVNFLIVHRSITLRTPNEQLTYLAKQFYRSRLRNSTEHRDIHLCTCRTNNINHIKHTTVLAWFQDVAKQAHIATQPALPIFTVSPRNSTEQLAGDLLSVDVSLQIKGKMENVASLTSVLLHQLQNHIVKKHLQRHCTQQSWRGEKNQQVCWRV